MDLARMVRVASVTLAMKETSVPTRHVSYPANMAAHVTKYPRAAPHAPARPIGRDLCAKIRSVLSSVYVALVNTNLPKMAALCTATVLSIGPATFVMIKYPILQVHSSGIICY